MASAKIHIVSTDDAFLAALHPQLAWFGLDVVLARDLIQATTLVATGEENIVIYDLEFGGDAAAHLACQAARRSRTLLVADCSNAEVIQLLGQFPRLDHVIGKRLEAGGGSLSTVLRRLLGQGPVDLGSVLAPGGSVVTERIADYRHTAGHLQKLHAYASALGCFDTFADLATSVAWELVMNGLFDAPLDQATGHPKYAHLPRSEGLIVDDAETVTLAYGHDAHHLAIAVTDPSGTLSRAAVVQSLTRCLREGRDQIRLKSSGAGIGLYMLFNSVSFLIFEVRPHQRTTVIAGLSRSRRLKDFEAYIRSVSFFGERS